MRNEQIILAVGSTWFPLSLTMKSRQSSQCLMKENGSFVSIVCLCVCMGNDALNSWEIHQIT